MAKKKKTTKKRANGAVKKTATRSAKKASKARPKKTAKKVKSATKAKTAIRANPKTKAAAFSVGAALPDFGADATSGGHFQLSQMRGRKIVLYFYPKDATPGCTLEGHDFTRLLSEFKVNGAEVYGISRDSLKSHEKFKSKECFAFDLLSDEDETLCNLFDVIKEKNMYGKKVMGIERSTFVIDSHGHLAAEWRGVKVPGHAEEVLAKVRSIA